MQQIVRRSAAESEHDVINVPPHGPRAPRIIQCGNLSRSQTTQNVGIVGLPVPVITLADERGSDGVERSRADAAGTFIEVARVLMKDGLHDHMPKDDAADVVRILGPETLSVALHPLAKFGIFVAPELESRTDPGVGDHYRIANGFPAEMKFLRSSQWSCVRCIANEEIRKEAQKALFLLSFQLLRGTFLL